MTLYMLRRLSPLILLVAFVIAAEPLLHNHPLQSSVAGSSGSAACAICATGVAPLPTHVAVVRAPQLLEVAYSVVVPPTIAVDTPLPRSPRAPPAA